MTLRSKIVLALLLTSLASVGLVGGVAYYELMRKFDDRMLQDAFGKFQGDVVAYARTYGSWDAGKRTEGFGQFVMRRHQPAPGTPPPELGVPPPEMPARDEPAPPPPEDGGPSEQDKANRPPFQFVLFGPSGKVLLPTPPYKVGDPVSDEDKGRALPILDGDRVIAYASPRGVATLSGNDIVYLNAMRFALGYGILAAAVLALLLGLLFGSALSRALRRLTRAIQSMGEGALRQRVEVESGDEVGVLARTFNRMSEELSKSHEALEESNRTIREQAVRLEELSIRDFLTELYNRRHFDLQAARLFESASRYQRPLTVMIGDIDFFKRINDRFTHAVGDDVLRKVADILRQNVRATDLVARYGGEEFVVAFPETPLPQAVALCEKLRSRIEAHAWDAIHPELKVTMSMGLDADLAVPSLETMLHTADGRLYQAKNSGRNRVCYG